MLKDVISVVRVPVCSVGRSVSVKRYFERSM